MPGPALVLASKSPQRRAILEQLGVAFDVVEPHVEESSQGPPGELVRGNALRKARAVAARLGGGNPILGVDTAVALGERTYGKPRDEAEARAFLEGLSGRAHQVWSGLVLVGGAARRDRDRVREAAAMTEVRFRRLETADLDWYVESGEWRGRAGGYAIQGRGAALVEGIVGDYWNVVGLPVAELVRLEPGIVRDR